MAAVNAGRHRVARGALGNVRALHDYALATEAAHPDAIHWIHIDPQRAGRDGTKELRRCIDKKRGFFGYAVSASLSSDPRVLLLDEPRQGLAPLVVRELGRVISLLRDAGVTILLIEQNMKLAESVADELHIMVKGRIVHSADAARFRIEEEQVRSRYLTV
jgi:ABC-type branched-subunit amino acid transport system ATPase component